MVQDAPAASVAPQALVLVNAVLLAPVRLMPEIVSAALPVLVRVKGWAELAVPAVTLPKFAVAGVRAAWGAGMAVPVPVSDAVCVPTASMTESVALKLPAELGAKLTAIVHAVPAASEDPQVLAPRRKLEPFAPPMPNEVMESAALPAFVRVKEMGALVVPAVMELKLPIAGVSAACGAAACTPVPLRAAVWVPASSVTEKVVVCAPADAGLNTRV